ncbi:hypothetical protein [Roseateles sp.]|uniref:hypothetical protein n=1 Tax=Roseateles sp. TaxID=1971397 RepID=UPI0031DABF33
MNSQTKATLASREPRVNIEHEDGSRAPLRVQSAMPTGDTRFSTERVVVVDLDSEYPPADVRTGALSLRAARHYKGPPAERVEKLREALYAMLAERHPRWSDRRLRALVAQHQYLVNLPDGSAVLAKAGNGATGLTTPMLREERAPC